MIIRHLRIHPFASAATRIPRVQGCLAALLFCAALACQSLWAAPHKIDDYHWDQVDRVVAIGDLHGDYASFRKALEGAGIIDARGNWIGGETHLVQLGDVPDRGPDTLKIIAHLKKLVEQARRKGGMVHTLLGNHEAMNTYGDLRYTSAGEYAAFAGRDSNRWRDRYYENVLADIKAREPERFATLPDDFREAWNASHPLGWVEHQRGWNPKWNPKAEYYEWALQDQVAIQINDLVFVHGGISGAYCQNTLASLTEMARTALQRSDPMTPSMLTDANGPLWYRGLAGVEPAAPPETVQAILEHHGAHHIVIGHTPTHGAIWPRYSGQVIQVDTGMTAFYGGHVAWLEETKDGLYAGYPAGKIRLPSDDAGRVDYLKQVIALQPDNADLQTQLSALEQPPRASEGDAGKATETAQGTTDAANAPAALPICGISQ
jgi:Calcineurin-like phosphoesterase